MRPGHSRQKSSDDTPGAPASPMMSPLPRHVRSGSTGLGNMKKGQTNAAKAAAQRLAQVMAHQSADDEDDEDDLSFNYSIESGTGSIGLAGGRAMRSQSPMSIRSLQEPPPHQKKEQPPSARVGSGSRLLQSSTPVEKPFSVRPISVIRPSQSNNIIEQPPSSRSTITTRANQLNNSIEQPQSSHYASTGRPQLGVKTVPVPPATVPISVRPVLPLTPTQVQVDIKRDKRLSLDMGSMILRDMDNQKSVSTSALQDELDMLQEENESLLEKLHLAEQRCEESDARARQLEKQVATIGEGVTLESRLLSRKEAALQQREAALRVAAQNHGGRNNQIAALETEAETARDEATSALEHLHEAEAELQSLRITAHRMILTQEEMEEVVMKRCWLARYWSLCVQYGIHAEIASARYEYWSSFAPLPIEVVLAAGQKAKEEVEARENTPRDINNLSGEANAETMLLVERGLRELSTLKVEDAVALAMAQRRRPNILKSNELKLPTEGQYDAFELSEEETKDVHFKQAWLTYFWRRAKTFGIEPDIADDRLQFWIDHNFKVCTSQDAVDVDRGFIELRKLGIENQLWEESRRGLELDSDRLRTQSTSNNSK